MRPVSSLLTMGIRRRRSSKRLLTLLSQCLLLVAIQGSYATQDPLALGVTAKAPPGSPYTHLTLQWAAELSFVKVQVVWEKCTYSDQQLTCRELGRQSLADPKATSFQLSDAAKYDSQHRVTVIGQDSCGHTTTLRSYVSVPRPADNKMKQAGAPTYIVIGPVYARNLTVSWSDLPGDVSQGRSSGVRGYSVTWRREDGQVGHPGHQSNLVNSGHLIRGLTPGTRYEVCVSERLGTVPSKTCDLVHTLEDAPGPPSPGDGWCRTEVHGTHWRCDVTWTPPSKPNGKITGYVLFWRDSEGYSLHEERPPGALCSPQCRSSAVLTFHPHEGCVAAITSEGVGWETCVRIHDVQSRLLAVFERKLLYAVAITLLLYILGPRVLGSFLRCCIRGLKRQFDDGKNHVV